METTSDVSVEPPPAVEARRPWIVLAPGPWRNALLTGLGSLLGILIAFGINAWWDQRSERERERAYLVALRSELMQARRAVLSHRVTLQNDVRKMGTTVAILSSPSATRLSDDSIVALDNFGVTLSFTPPRAALDDVVQSGGLTLIRSDSLRRLLASYEQALARDLQTQEPPSNIFLEQIAPYRYQHSDLQRAAGKIFPLPDLGHHVDRTAFVGNRTYANLLLARMIRVSAVISTHDSILSEIDAILPMLKGY